MILGLLPRRLLSLMVALAIFMVTVPLLPADAASGCDQMSMASMPVAMDMKMDMKSQPARDDPAKHKSPCDGITCLGAAGCCAPAIHQVSVASLSPVGAAIASWTSRSAPPGIAYKPALPPPILRV